MGGEIVHLIARQLFDMAVELPGLADRDAEFRLPAGRGDDFVDGGGLAPRDKSRPVMRPEMFDHDLRIETLKMRARNFHKIPSQTMASGSSQFKSKYFSACPQSISLGRCDDLTI